MGKKSKRKNNNKPPTGCYHGCTKQEFNNSGEHYKVLEEYDRQLLDFNNDGDERCIDINKIYEKHKRVMVAPTFGNFVIARITSDYLIGKDDATLRQRLWLFLSIRYFYIPRNEGKDVGPESEITKNYQKYMRDIQTERGMINCIAREIPCECMEEKRIAAKLMDKVAMCWCCLEDFPKKVTSDVITFSIALKNAVSKTGLHTKKIVENRVFHRQRKRDLDHYLVPIGMNTIMGIIHSLRNNCEYMLTVMVVMMMMMTVVVV